MRWHLLVSVLLCVPAAAADMRAARRAAADRPRTLICNNDGNEPIYYMTEPTAANLLALRTAPLEGSGVRSIFYCSISSPFGVLSHHTRVGDRFDTREGRYANNQTRGLFEAGVDPLAEVVGWCRKHDVECFWSMRMNDTHDSNGEDYAPLILATNSLKRDNCHMPGAYREALSRRAPESAGKKPALNARPSAPAFRIPSFLGTVPEAGTQP